MLTRGSNVQQGRFDWVTTEDLNTILNALMFSMGNRTNFRAGELADIASLAVEIEDEIIDRERNG